MRKKISIIATIFLLCSLFARAEGPLQEKIEDILKDPALRGASIALCVQDADGNTLVDVNGDRLMVPSSNVKLVTTGAALHHFGRNYSFSTTLACEGSIRDSVLRGNLYIIGGADPTLGSSDAIALPQAELFEKWRRALKSSGIKAIEGKVVGDGSYIDGMKESPLWQYDDLGTYYGSGVSGLQWHENYISLKVSPGERVGDSLRVEFIGPETPWIRYRKECQTGERGTGDQVYLYASDNHCEAFLTGTFALGKPTKNLKVSNKFPERTCAYLFSEHLKAHGFKNGGYDATDKLGGRERPDHLRELFHSNSPALKDIVKSCNTESNNVYAETLLRVLGREVCSSACYDSCYVALERELEGLGLSGRDSSGRKTDALILDGSGLARQNLISPLFFCRFLRAMMGSPCFRDYLATIPQPGLQGTVKPCLRMFPSAERRRVRMKSGSMTGIRCYSGYILPRPTANPGPTLVFSLMINNCTANQYQLRNVTDAMIGALL